MNLSAREIYISKQKDTDLMFRLNSVDEINSRYQTFTKFLPLNKLVRIDSMFNDIYNLAYSNDLFQRALVEESMKERYSPDREEMNIVSTIIDRAFARANADTSSAIPLSLVSNQLTGKWLNQLLRYSFTDLYTKINKLTWSQVYALSQHSDWKEFVQCLNALIFIFQRSPISKHNNIESNIEKICVSYGMYRLVNYLKDTIISEEKATLFKYGAIPEFQNIQLLEQMAENIYTGKYKSIIDLLSLIEIISQKISKVLGNPRYEYLLSLGNSQKSKDFFIRSDN